MGITRSTLINATLLLSLALAPALLGQPEAPKPFPPLTPQDACSLLALVRHSASPATTDAPNAVPEALRRTGAPPVVFTLHQVPAIYRQAAGATLAESAALAGKEFASLIAHLPDGARRLAQGRIQCDIVLAQKPLEQADPLQLLRELRPGIDGLGVTSGETTIWLTPLTLFANWRTQDPLKFAYGAQENSALPVTFTVRRFTPDAWVEEAPGGRALPVYRANVLTPSPAPEQTVKAVFHAGRWLLNTQQDDGSFLPRYDPTQEKEVDRTTLVDHLRATITLTLLHQITHADEFEQARKKAVGYATAPERIKSDPAGLVYLPMETDDVSATALLLTALCVHALAQPDPSADAMMRRLGDYLCAMTAADGRLHARLDAARRNAPPYLVRGGPYAETLLALSLLQRVSPTERVSACAGRIANLLSKPSAEAQLRGDQRTTARMIEALGQYYRITRRQAELDALMEMAGKLMERQLLGARALYPDFDGGFAEVGLAPDTFTTAMSACALSAAYEAAMLSRRDRARFSAPTRAAAHFLANMQYRAESSFFLARPEMALGAFRRSPEDLTIHTAAAAEAARALALATTVIVETVAPIEPEKITPNW